MTTPPPADPALLAAANRALHAEVEALRRQVAELESAVKAERFHVAGWIRGLYVGEGISDVSVGLLRVVAAQIEAGAHRVTP